MGKKNTSNVWFVGNSQLMTSLLAAYCPADVRARVAQDWQAGRVSHGAFENEDQDWFSFLACSAELLGDSSFHDGNLSYTRNMDIFVSAVDKDASVIIIMLRGNEFALHALVDTPQWDFAWKGERAVTGRQCVRQRDVLAHFEKIMHPLLASCLHYRWLLPKAKVVYVAAPPPIESEQYILDNPEVFADFFKKFGVRHFAQRKRIYQAMYQPLAQALANYGVDVVFAPSDVLTENGGLRTEFAHGCLHGNAQYGKALMRDLKQRGIYASV